MDDVIEKIKNKDFEINYKEAIELWKIFEDWRASIKYVWKETIGNKVPELMYVELGMFSDVKLHIKK